MRSAVRTLLANANSRDHDKFAKIIHQSVVNTISKARIDSGQGGHGPPIPGHSMIVLGQGPPYKLPPKKKMRFMDCSRKIAHP
jgi:hypothetical protein